MANTKPLAEQVVFQRASVGAVARTLADKASETVSVEDFGAVSSASLQKAIDSLDTASSIYTGGKVEIPTGQHGMSAEVIVDNDSADNILGVSLIGKGKQATTLSFASQPAGQNGLEYTSPIFAGIQDLCVRDSKGDGVRFVGWNTNPTLPSWNHFNMDRVRLSFNAGSGIDADRGFMGHFNQVFATHNVQQGLEFKGLHTSLLFNNCYAESNAINGFRLNELTYSVMNACAADKNAVYGYAVTKSSTLVLNGCGSESNGRAGFVAESSTALGQNYPIMLNGFLAFNNNTSNSGFPNAIYILAANSVPSVVVARGCRSHNPANATVDALVSGVGAYLVDEDNSFPNGVASQGGGYIHHVHRTKYIHGLSVTAATTVCELMNPQGHQGSYGGEIIIHASNTSPNSSSAKNTATYKLLVDNGAGGGSVVEVAKVGLTAGAGATHPSFTWSLVGNNLTATPVGSTSGTFYFEVLCHGFVKIK